VERDPDSSTSRGRREFWRPFAALMALGLLGIASLAPFAVAQRALLPPEMALLPLPVLVLVVMINPLILLLVAVTVGLLLAERLGFCSLVVDWARERTPVWRRLRRQLIPAIGLGLVVSALIVGLDLALEPHTGLDPLQPGLEVGRAAQLAIGMLYGGITEELLLRWGLMSFLAWLGVIAVDRRAVRPPRNVVRGAILVAALLFGIAHLPAMALVADLNAAVVARTVALNALGGVAYGWLFWRRSLEAAMVAHASSHVGMAILLGLLLRAS
jgi:hypothetical protein